MNTQHPEEAVPSPELILIDEDDLSAIDTRADPSQVTTLALWECSLGDLTPLTKLTQLTTLSLSWCGGSATWVPWLDCPTSLS